MPPVEEFTDQEWLIQASIAYCNSANGQCIPAEKTWRVPLRSGSSETTIRCLTPLSATMTMDQSQ